MHKLIQKSFDVYEQLRCESCAEFVSLMKDFVNQFVEQEQKELGELPTFQKLEEVVTSFKARPGRLWYQRCFVLGVFTGGSSTDPAAEE